MINQPSGCIAAARPPCGVRTRTISSAPVESTSRPLNWPRAVLVDATHAASPCTITLASARVLRTARANAIPQPRGELPLAELAFGEGEHGHILLFVRGSEYHAVQLEKGAIGNVGCAFVAVQERMVARKTVRESSGEVAKVRRGIAIGVKLLWPRQR